MLSWKSLLPYVQEALNLALWDLLGTLVRIVLVGEGGEGLRELEEEQLETTPLRDFDTKGNRDVQMRKSGQGNLIFLKMRETIPYLYAEGNNLIKRKKCIIQKREEFLESYP